MPYPWPYTAIGGHIPMSEWDEYPNRGDYLLIDPHIQGNTYMHLPSAEVHAVIAYEGWRPFGLRWRASTWAVNLWTPPDGSLMM